MAVDQHCSYAHSMSATCSNANTMMVAENFLQHHPCNVLRIERSACPVERLVRGGRIRGMIAAQPRSYCTSLPLP